MQRTLLVSLFLIWSSKNCMNEKRAFFMPIFLMVQLWFFVPDTLRVLLFLTLSLSLSISYGREVYFLKSRNQKVQLRENVFPTSSHVKVRNKVRNEGYYIIRIVVWNGYVWRACNVHSHIFSGWQELSFRPSVHTLHVAISRR